MNLSDVLRFYKTINSEFHGNWKECTHISSGFICTLVYIFTFYVKFDDRIVLDSVPVAETFVQTVLPISCAFYEQYANAK